jgi:hypothetical protein
MNNATQYALIGVLSVMAVWVWALQHDLHHIAKALNILAGVTP